MNLSALDREIGLKPMPYYQRKITAIMAEVPHAPHITARHVEALMRADHATLDALSAEGFRKCATRCILAANTVQSVVLDIIARSYGL